jgi:transcription elongation factor Elf1
MKCPRCRNHQLVEIALRLGTDEVVLRSCSSCDLRSWEGLDGRMPLGSVLEIAARR